MPLDEVVFEDAASLARVAAELMYAAIVQAVATRGVARVALSGGSTPRAAYRLLGILPFDRERTRWYFVDERSVPPTSDRSNFALAREELLSPAEVPARRVFRMEAEREPMHRSASDYATLLLAEFGLTASQALALDEAGRSPLALDLVVAGIGPDGHTASLFPGTGAAVREDTLVTVVTPGGELEPRLSLTRPVLVGAHRVLILCTGREKSAALRLAQSEGSEDEVPARIYRRARPGAVTLLVDRDAAR
jgi:6-phosphogluconolactonase